MGHNRKFIFTNLKFVSSKRRPDTDKQILIHLYNDEKFRD